MVESFKFSAGELQVKIPLMISTNRVDVVTRIKSADDIMELLLVKDAIDRNTNIKLSYKTLVIPYLPYSRQDRVMNRGEALSVKVMCDLINSMNFDHVITWDNHSDVGTALLNNCTNVEQHELLEQFDKNNWNLANELYDHRYVLVSPDAGADKKTIKIAQHFDGLEVVNASKVRDTKTGNITATKVNYDGEININGADFLIVDDICDGGFTFIKLAEELKRYNPDSISLYVTHGIFSKGYQVLFDAGISKIYTTDSFKQTHEVQGLKVLSL
jgi:ribose-phosphate pyrophosphokinase